ncbi:glycosyltransferase [Cladorrhinum sp. PSN332]|nr:glycosyltransferase [Cladorrhinum sp. PSN332]
MLFTPTRPWRWLRVAAVFGILWLMYQVASEHQLRTSSEPDVCRPHGWRRFHRSSSSPKSQPRKVYDLMMVNTEVDWLEIRMNSTWDEVDYFVIVESGRTFTGLDKPLVLKQNLAKLERYASKMIYHEVEYPADFHALRAWDNEDFQRNSMLVQVFPKLVGTPKEANYGDVIIVSDVDEVPKPSTLAVLRACDFPRRLTLRSRFYYYSFQYLHRGAEWSHPQATYYQGLSKTLLPNDLRIGDGGMWPFKLFEKGDFWNASWHCSSCFETMDELLTKMKSFAHVWMNAERFRDRKRIADRIRNGKDMWDREGEVYDRIENNQDVPSLLLLERERFGYLLNRDGPTAGFKDYNE